MYKVLISDKLSPKAKEIFDARGIQADVIVGMTPDELKACIGEYDGLAIRSATKATKEIIESATNLKVIARAGIGTDNVDKEAATEKGIVVMNTPFGNSTTTAEHTISLMLSLARRIPEADASTHQGKWEKSKFMGVEVSNKTLGLIGCGNIGGIVADRAKGLKMKVIAFDPYLSKEKAESVGIEKVEFDDLISRADFISLHTPLTDSTRNMINADVMSNMKTGVRIINCARGGLIVEKDLKQAIETGHVAGAALDVFEVEPAKENVLFGMENVVLTPHLGASTDEAQVNVAVQAAEQISDFLLEGVVTNALNMPSVSAEDAVKLDPYIALAGKLGNFAGQVSKSGIKQIRVEYTGDVAKLNTKPVTASALNGVLTSISEEGSVNMINAPKVAEARGIEVSEVICETIADYQSLVRITLVTDEGDLNIAGTLFGNQPRILEVNSIKLEAGLSGDMLYVSNEDKAGTIGLIGAVLGEAGLNIANFHLGRCDTNAVSLIETDNAVSTDVADKIRSIAGVECVQCLKL